jgi:hypothetical protein
MKNPRGGASGGFQNRAVSVLHLTATALKAAFALQLFPGELARTAHGFGGFARFFHGRFLEMLLELHFPKNAFALELFLQSPKGLLDVIVADTDLHVVVTTFLG